MTVSEAITLLSSLPGYLEVTLIFGKANITTNPGNPFRPLGTPPTWTPDSPITYNTITAVTPNYH